MTISHKELQLCRDLFAQRYQFEKRLEAFDSADMPGEIFFDGDAIWRGLQKKAGEANELKGPKAFCRSLNSYQIIKN